MSPIQQMLLGAGSAVASKNWIDDCFSTFLYEGTGSAQSINNGIDQSGEGSLTWIKDRDDGNEHMLFDTARGATKYIMSDASSEESTATNGLTSFNNNGFTVGDWNWVNENNHSFASWTFRKAPGFFDVVTYTASTTNAGDTQVVNHSLGSVPGLIVIKRTDSSSNWIVYHKSLGNDKYVTLNQAYQNNTNMDQFDKTDPTASSFTVEYTGTGNTDLAIPNATYVAYIFAGGESTASEAVSVDFDGSGDYLSIPDNDAWDISSSDATIECWVNFDSHNGHDGIIHNLHSSGLPGNGTSGWALEPVGGTLNVYWGTTAGGYGNVQGAKIPLGQWQHLAVTKSGSTITIYQDGVKTGSGSITGTINPGVVPLNIGGNCVGEDCDCKISNVRITKGQVLYTSSFKPSTVPLTTTSQGATASNVKLLCCNGSTTTSSTVTPGTITANGDPTASSDSPFDDPAGFVFGDAEDQNVIKCGSYVGNGSATGPEIFLGNGWEPQWLLVKCSSFANQFWNLFDNMRGIVNGGNDKWLLPNVNYAEPTAAQRIDLTSTGFKLASDEEQINKDGETYIYMAIRRPDGYVGKPTDAGTDVFTTVTMGATSAPGFRSDFPVDFALYRQPAATHHWGAISRLAGAGDEHTRLYTNTTGSDVGGGAYKFDYNNGWITWSSDASYQSWMWKRHAGFDVVTYAGNSVAGRQIQHSMNAVPEMLWVKSRTGNDNWRVYHSGVVGGYDSGGNWNTNSNAAKYQLYLNLTNSSVNNTSSFNETEPTLTTFTLGTTSGTNSTGNNYIAMLFASVDGISKVGSYTGSGSSNTQTITTGFQPRFVIIKDYTGNNNPWYVMDTTRGWGSGDDKQLMLNSTQSELTNDWGAPTSTGFTVTGNGINLNSSSNKYIYYAHA